MASVALREVSKRYPHGVIAVDNLSLEVQDREFLVLVGPSGCGKSTTLRMIAGLEDVSGGTIEIGERDVTRTAPKDRDIAMVFQNYALYPHMTVERNMAFGLELRCGGWLRSAWKRLTSPAEAAALSDERRRIPDRVRDAARILGIENLLKRMPRQLSGGERQRVALGRAIVREPAAFLFDEPLSNLDARLRVEMRHELKRLHRRLDTTMIYVTHDQVEAMTLGQRIVVMQGGKIQQIGPPMEVYERPRNRFVAGFLGSPPMNFVAGRLVREAGETTFHGGGLEVGLSVWERTGGLPDQAGRATMPGRGEAVEVVLGVRPEQLSPVATRSEMADSETADTEMADSETADVDAKAAAARVSLVETLGDQAVVHVEVAAEDAEPAVLVCKADARCSLEVGDAVRLRVDASRVHLFDAASGESLAAKAE
ncbi:MAG: ATP-binding cassette domain-containing protein [Pirellulaceae bacterium]